MQLSRPGLQAQLSVPVVDPSQLLSLYTDSEVAKLLTSRLHSGREALGPLAQRMQAMLEARGSSKGEQ